MTNNLGRPSKTADEALRIFRKIEPFLKAGLSLHKACLQSGIPKSTVYDLQANNPEFSEKVELAQQYPLVIASGIVTNELTLIKRRQKKDRGLDAKDRQFVQWFLTTAKVAKDDFSENNPEEPAFKESVYTQPQSVVTIMKVYEAVRNNLLKQQGGENDQLCTKTVT